MRRAAVVVNTRALSAERAAASKNVSHTLVAGPVVWDPES